MPTNLPAEYYEAEEIYRAASTAQEKISTLEDLISTVPKHKGTDKLRADLRRRLSKLKESSHSTKGVSRHISAYQIDREGAGQAAIVGSANVGKSSLLEALTNASPEVADYPFTTWTPTPGMMELNNAQIQLIDTPPLNREYIEPALLDLIRRAELILLVIDLQADPIGQLEETIALLAENRIIPDNRQDRYRDQIRLKCLPVLVVVNKDDDESTHEDFEILCELLEGKWNLIPVSTSTGYNLDLLKQVVIDLFEIIRVYSKPPGRDPDLNQPFVLKKGSTIQDFAGKVHRDFFDNLKYARVWGSGAFDGQMVSREYILCDGDVVELRM